MAFSADVIKAFLRLKGNLSIESENYSPDELKDFAKFARIHKVHLTIKCPGESDEVIKDLIKLGKEHITLELF